MEFELDTTAILRLMAERNLSRLDVARALGITAAAVRSLESGRNYSRLTLPIISKLAQVLGTDARALILPRIEPGCSAEMLSEVEDHVKLEAVLSIVRRGITRAELCRMLGWTLRRLQAAIGALDAALLQRGQRLHRLSGSRLALRPADEVLTRDEQERVRNAMMPREGLRLREAELLAAVMHGQVTTRSGQLSGTNMRAMLASLLNRGLVRLDGSRYELTSDACEALLLDEFAAVKPRRRGRSPRRGGAAQRRRHSS